MIKDIKYDDKAKIKTNLFHFSISKNVTDYLVICKDMYFNEDLVKCCLSYKKFSNSNKEEYYYLLKKDNNIVDGYIDKKQIIDFSNNNYKKIMVLLINYFYSEKFGTKAEHCEIHIPGNSNKSKIAFEINFKLLKNEKIIFDIIEHQYKEVTDQSKETGKYDLVATPKEYENHGLLFVSGGHNYIRKKLKSHQAQYSSYSTQDEILKTKSGWLYTFYKFINGLSKYGIIFTQSEKEYTICFEDGNNRKLYTDVLNEEYTKEIENFKNENKFNVILNGSIDSNNISDNFRAKIKEFIDGEKDKSPFLPILNINFIEHGKDYYKSNVISDEVDMYNKDILTQNIILDKKCNEIDIFECAIRELYWKKQINDKKLYNGLKYFKNLIPFDYSKIWDKTNKVYIEKCGCNFEINDKQIDELNNDQKELYKKLILKIIKEFPAPPKFVDGFLIKTKGKINKVILITCIGEKYSPEELYTLSNRVKRIKKDDKCLFTEDEIKENNIDVRKGSRRNNNNNDYLKPFYGFKYLQDEDDYNWHILKIISNTFVFSPGKFKIDNAVFKDSGYKPPLIVRNIYYFDLIDDNDNVELEYADMNGEFINFIVGIYTNYLIKGPSISKNLASPYLFKIMREYNKYYLPLNAQENNNDDFDDHIDYDYLTEDEIFDLENENGALKINRGQVQLKI